MKFDVYLLVNAKNRREAQERANKIFDHIEELRCPDLSNFSLCAYDLRYEDKMPGDDRYAHDTAVEMLNSKKGVEMKKRAMDLNQSFMEGEEYATGYHFYDMFGCEVRDDDQVERVKDLAVNNVRGESLFIVYGGAKA